MFLRSRRLASVRSLPLEETGQARTTDSRFHMLDFHMKYALEFRNVPVLVVLSSPMLTLVLPIDPLVMTPVYPADMYQVLPS